MTPTQSTLLREWKHAIIQKQQKKSSPNLISPQHTLETRTHYICSKANRSGVGPFPTIAPRVFHGTSSYVDLSFWIQTHNHIHTYTIQMKRQKIPHNPRAAGTRTLPFKQQFWWAQWINGNPLQYSCLKNPMDRGTWRATVQKVTNSQTRVTEHAPAKPRFSHKLSPYSEKVSGKNLSQDLEHVCAQSPSLVQLFASPWTIDHQAPMSMRFSRQ